MKLGFVVLFSIIILPAYCMAGDVELLPGQFQESYIKEVNISGSVRAGVMFESKSEVAGPEDLHIYLSDKNPSILEVKMISIDGRYEADFNYPVKNEETGITKFKLPTKMAHIISHYPPDQLAVLARLKKPENSSKGEIVPATWGKPESKNLKIFLNSGVSTTLLKLYRTDGSTEKIVCKKIDADNVTAYDTECRVNEAGQYEMSKTKIIRKNFDSYFKPVKLNINCRN